MNQGQVGLADGLLFKLRMQLGSHLASAAENYQPGGIGVQTVSHPQLMIVNLIENPGQCVTVETPAGVHRQRSGLVERDQKIILVNQFDLRVYIRLSRGRQQMLQPLALSDKIIFGQHFAIVDHPLRLDLLQPDLAGNMRMILGYEIDQAITVIPLRHIHWPKIVIGHRAGQGSGDVLDLQPPLSLQHLLPLLGRLITNRTRNRRYIFWRVQVRWFQNRLASKTNLSIRLLQLRVDSHSLVEHKTIAIVMLSATVFEILQDPAIELKN